MGCSSGYYREIIMEDFFEKIVFEEHLHKMNGKSYKNWGKKIVERESS